MEKSEAIPKGIKFVVRGEGRVTSTDGKGDQVLECTQAC